jgi:hypothetical protein
VPLCGTWGSMDTDWTDAGGEVTCAACRIALRDAGPERSTGRAPTSVGRLEAAGRAPR